MRLKHSYFYTLREDVKHEESISGNLLTRSGMIKKSSSGVYMYLPLGYKVIKNIDFIASDIKLNSCAKQGDLFDLHKKFLQVTKENNVETFLKIVFDENITEIEINKCIELAKEFDYKIFLQPKMNESNFECDLNFAISIFDAFKEKYSNTIFCPQMHKFWGVR